MSIDVTKVLLRKQVQNLCSHATFVRRNHHTIAWCYRHRMMRLKGSVSLWVQTRFAERHNLFTTPQNAGCREVGVRVTFHIFCVSEPHFATCYDWAENSGWVMVGDDGSKDTPLLHKKEWHPAAMQVGMTWLLYKLTPFSLSVNDFEHCSSYIFWVRGLSPASALE